MPEFTAANDVIIATACDYCWAPFKNYAVSLSESGFRGRKILFVNNITSVARQALLKLGFELIDFEKKERNVVIQRFKLLADWLDANRDVRYVIQSDVKDVVVQRDPSSWMETQTAEIFGASEFILYCNEKCNPEWVEKVYGVKGVVFLSNEEVVCAGTIAGTADAMRKLSRRIYELSEDRFGDDQAILNMLLRTEFKETSRIPKWNEGFILTAGWWLITTARGNPDQVIGRRSMLHKNPPEIRDGVMYPNGSETPYCIVHQYERPSEPLWSAMVDKRYNAPFIVEDDNNILPPKTVTRINRPLKYAADGLTIDWHDYNAKV